MTEEMTQSKEDTTQEAEGLLYTLARIYAQRGQAKEVAILADAEPFLRQTDYDNWDGGIYLYTLYLRVSHTVYAQIEADREEIERQIQEEAGRIFRIEAREDQLSYVRIGPKIGEADPQWREKAKSWAAGKGLTNQGRVRSSNIASKSEDGLLFRSQPEINLYQALKKQGVSFAPLPVFVRGGKTYQRMEPDFIVIKNGITLQVEVDGDTVHTETPAEAQTRVAMLEDEGVFVHRIAASRCDTTEKAEACAMEIIAKINTRKSLK